MEQMSMQNPNIVKLRCGNNVTRYLEILVTMGKMPGPGVMSRQKI
jgi:hypothetical protein